MKKIAVIVCLSLFIMQAAAFAQLQNTDSTTMYYLQLKPVNYSKNLRHDFLFIKGPWHSPVITPILEDSLGTFVRLFIPDSIYEPQMYLAYKAIEKCAATDTTQHSVVRVDILDLTTVQLSITSNPRKVLVYLIPTRVWLNEIKKSNWKADPSSIDRFLLKDDYTSRNLIVGIDDTAYTLIFRLSNRYIIKAHKLQPGHEHFQQERADFAKKLFSD